MLERIIHMMPQGSEEWEKIRKGKATASRFKDIITPAKLQFSKSAEKYAIELIAERLGVESPQFIGTEWMSRGIEAEPYALDEFRAKTGHTVTTVGFVEYGGYLGCSPDGLVNDDSILEIKCPKSETLIKYILDGELPSEYILQVQGEMWVTGRDLAHFWGWHPELEPFHVVVEKDEEVHDAFDKHIPKFLTMTAQMFGKVKSRPIPDGWQLIDCDEELI